MRVIHATSMERFLFPVYLQMWRLPALALYQLNGYHQTQEQNERIIALLEERSSEGFSGATANPHSDD